MGDIFKYGQFVIGAPGSGKTTYCQALAQYFKAVGRSYAIINLDPANDTVTDWGMLCPIFVSLLTHFWFDFLRIAIDINELITLEDAMEQCVLGPNGGLTYWMEFLEKNYEWLDSKIWGLDGDPYLIFDLPGQVELYTNHYSLKNVIQMFMKKGY